MRGSDRDIQIAVIVVIEDRDAAASLVLSSPMRAAISVNSTTGLS